MNRKAAAQVAAWACVVTALVGLTQGLLNQWMVAQVQTGTYEGLGGFSLVFEVLNFTDALAMATFAGGLWVLAGGTAGLRPAAIGATVLASVAACFLIIGHLGLASETLQHFHQIVGWVRLGALLLADGALLAVLWRQEAARPPIFLAASAAVAIYIGLFLVLYLTQIRVPPPWPSMVALAHDLGLAVLLWRLARRTQAKLSLEKAGAFGLGAPAAAGALLAFRQIVIIRVVVVLLAVVAGVVVGRSGDLESFKALTYLSAYVGFLLGVLLIAALGRFASATPAGAGAGAAGAALMGLGLLLEVWALTAYSDLFSGHLGTAMTRLPWIEGIAQLLSLIALLTVISACRAVATIAGDAPLAAEAGGVGTLAAVLAGLMLLMRGLMAMRGAPLVLAAVFGLGLLVLAVLTLVRVLGLLKRTARVLAYDPSRAFD